MKLLNIINEQQDYITNEKKFVVNNKNNKFLLYLDNVLVSKSGFNIEQPDQWFDQKYLSLFNIKTAVNYRGKGLAKYLLYQIFDYTKTKLNIHIITLIVYKNNNNALNLYLNCGFELFMEYDDSYSLIKKL